ncbi:hypothetical protein GGR52DRAFT_590930 [Hypoxylon sp. FL1284]|nr:hypothetical protein GGR52DRAFT_590930 [Hypoxylon sp. FL1284]
MTPAPEPSTRLIYKSEYDDMTIAPSVSVKSASELGVESDEEAFAASDEPSNDQPATPRKEKKRKQVDSSLTATPPRSFTPINSPSTRRALTTPRKETFVGRPTTPKPRNGGNNGHITTSPRVSAPARQGAKSNGSGIEEIVRASTLCQEDLVKGLPSSFRPVDRSRAIESDSSDSSGTREPSDSKPDSEDSEDYNSETSAALPKKKTAKSIKTAKLHPAPPTKKRPRSPSSSPATGAALTYVPSPRSPAAQTSVPAFRHNHVVSAMVRGLKDEWAVLLKKCGWRLGSPRAVNTRFEPDVAAIGAAAPVANAPSLGAVADAVEDALLDAWRAACRRTVEQYRRDFRRDLVAEARERGQGVKERAVREAEALEGVDGRIGTRFEALEWLPAAPVFRPGVALPLGPPALGDRSSNNSNGSRSRNNKRQASIAADVLQAQERIARLSIRDSGSGSGSGSASGSASDADVDADSGRWYQASPTPSGSKKQKVMVSSTSTGSPLQRQRQQQPTPTPRFPRGNGSGSRSGRGKVVGRIGRYAVTSAPRGDAAAAVSGGTPRFATPIPFVASSCGRKVMAMDVDDDDVFSP